MLTPIPIYILQNYPHRKGDKQNMYRQQSLITLDQFYEWKPLSKLEVPAHCTHCNAGGTACYCESPGTENEI